MKQSGQTLIQVVVAIGLMSVFLMVFMTMTTNMNRQIQVLKDQLARADFQQQLTKSFADGTLCTSLLLNSTFTAPGGSLSSTNPGSKNLSMTSLPASKAASAPTMAEVLKPVSSISENLVVSSTNSFQLANIVGSSNGSVGTFTASFQVNFDSSRLALALKPASTLVTLHTVVSGNTQTVASCTLANMGPIGGCELYVSSGVVGLRLCWGSVIDGGTTLSCPNGSAPVPISMGTDPVSPGETTTNGADLYTLCQSDGPHQCHVETDFCF